MNGGEMWEAGCRKRECAAFDLVGLRLRGYLLRLPIDLIAPARHAADERRARRSVDAGGRLDGGALSGADGHRRECVAVADDERREDADDGEDAGDEERVVEG